jgi:hypothetical protein
MDIDPDEDTLPDAGAIEDGEDEIYSDRDVGQKRRRLDSESESEDDSTLAPNLHPEDVWNFMKLSAALKLLLSEEITEQDITTAATLLREYCVELISVGVNFNRFDVLLMIWPAPWTQSDQTKPPLCNARPPLCARLRPTSLLLDFPFRTDEQATQELQYK